jgi:antitoxin PrlF
MEPDMIVSKITSKAQTTIPLAVRKALRLQEGDLVGYEIRDGKVILSRASAAAEDDPYALFEEWAGEADTKAYAGF